LFLGPARFLNVSTQSLDSDYSALLTSGHSMTVIRMSSF
jgi:hypothetical protein